MTGAMRETSEYNKRHGPLSNSLWWCVVYIAMVINPVWRPNLALSNPHTCQQQMIIYGNMYLQGFFPQRYLLFWHQYTLYPIRTNRLVNSFSATPLLMILVNWNPSQGRLRR